MREHEQVRSHECWNTYPIAIIDGRADLAGLKQRAPMGLPGVVRVVRGHEPVARSDSIPVVDSDVEFRCPDLGALDEKDQRRRRRGDEIRLLGVVGTSGRCQVRRPERIHAEDVGRTVTKLNRPSSFVRGSWARAGAAASHGTRAGDRRRSAPRQDMVSLEQRRRRARRGTPPVFEKKRAGSTTGGGGRSRRRHSNQVLLRVRVAGPRQEGTRTPLPDEGKLGSSIGIPVGAPSGALGDRGAAWSTRPLARPGSGSSSAWSGWGVAGGGAAPLAGGRWPAADAGRRDGVSTDGMGTCKS